MSINLSNICGRTDNGIEGQHLVDLGRVPGGSFMRIVYVVREPNEHHKSCSSLLQAHIIQQHLAYAQRHI